MQLNFEVCVGDHDYSVEAEVEGYSENYGADADGNRGLKQNYVEAYIVKAIRDDGAECDDPVVLTELEECAINQFCRETEY